MELRHLRYFVAVAEALNFTKASAQLRVAQPALSRQVQDLEDEKRQLRSLHRRLNTPQGMTTNQDFVHEVITAQRNAGLLIRGAL